ncbi:MAG: GNAT family N-acetyltransferase [Candidatus Dormibacteraeota bacterium]|nr:GNAT family N-acetyltransferase [Candidatus Dormibacteraeota bacterium]
MAIDYRPARPDDTVACHELMWASVTDLGRRQGTPLQGTAEEWWRSQEHFHRLLAETAAAWWVAVESDSGRLAGFARCIEREGLLELTELFVRPGVQSRGVGKALLERAFPVGRGAAVRSIIATTDVRAQARYYAAGTVARFPLYTLGAAPRDAEPIGDLEAEPMEGEGAIEAQRAIERSVLGHRRSNVEVRWLLQRRRGHLYRRAGTVAGFSFLGADGSGPIAALEPADLPAVLAHVESLARSMGLPRLELEVPAPNVAAINHLMGRRFQFDPWINLLMSDRPFGQFDRFVPFSPALFL